jgi:hypothetical protein
MCSQNYLEMSTTWIMMRSKNEKELALLKYRSIIKNKFIIKIGKKRKMNKL